MQVYQVLPNPYVPIGVPSPTLTNPDMILPDSSPSTGSSPSTPRQHQRLPSPSAIESNGNNSSGSASDEKPRVKGAMYSPFRNGVLRRHDGSTRLRSSSESGNYRISFKKNRLSYQQGGEVPFASSPTLQEDSNDFGQRIYTDSTQGDYENGEGTYNTPSILEEDESDPYSHAAMTKRAEEILANAKKRLTNMEGNLNRARSTLNSRPSSSMSSFGDRNPEPVSLYTIPGKGRHPGGFSTSKHRQARLPSLDETKQGHSRVFSETSVPSSLQTGLSNGQPAQEKTEALNGLGISEEDTALRDRHSEPSRNWFWNGLTRNTSLNYANRHANGLQALNEDGPAPESFEERVARQDDIEEERSVDLQSPTAAAFNAQNPPAIGLTRARSTTQMHDLREQMQDLKGKISTLKQRARDDNLRRRSLQSLRTPSPFTAAEQWYNGTPSPEDAPKEAFDTAPVQDTQDTQETRRVENQGKDAPQGSGHASPIAELHSGMANDDEVELNYDPLEEVLQGDKKAVVELPGGEYKIVNGLPSQKERLILVDEATPVATNDHAINTLVVEPASPVEDDVKEDSLYGDQDYHETPTSPIVQRHEDRPDAFDYQHFVLNSAIGTYSGVGVRRSSSMRKRPTSQSSESSVETTKPRNSMGDAPLGDTHHTNGGHGRQNSVDSVSTVNTFATATEGKDSEDDWTPRKPMAGSWQPEKSKNHKANGSNESASDRLQSNGLRKYGSKKHIATAQKGYMNGVRPTSPPLQNDMPSQTPDVLAVLSATGSWQEGAPPKKLKLGDRDKELVERLVKSLSKVCSQVHSLGSEGNIYEARVFRRKLDAARRVLDGEMNGEAF